MSAPAGPPVTVVVMTRNRWDDLAASLPHHEAPVIVVDNGSTDGTPQRVRQSFPSVAVIELHRNLAAVARNVGVEAATTPYVAFADDDSWWEPGALARAAAILDAHPRLAVLAGRILVGTDGRPDPVCEAMAASPLGTEADLPGPSVLGFVACGAVVRRDAFLDAGGFDQVIGFPGEEEGLALDLADRGWGLAYVDDVVAHHHPSSSRSTSHARRVLETRNDLLTCLLHRPWPVVGRRFLDVWRAGSVGRAAVLRAIRRAPRALRHRRPTSPSVEMRRRRLDGLSPG